MILKQFSDVWLKRTIMLVPKDRDTKGAEYGPTQGQACLSGSISKPQILDAFLSVLHDNPFQRSVISQK